MENKTRTSHSMEANQSVHTDICEELRDEQHSVEPMPKRLCLRTCTNLESDKYQPCYLNTQLITILSTLGVKDGVFEKKQREFVQKLDASLNNRLEAHEILRLMAPRENTNILKALLLCYKPNCEPFLSMMLQNLRASMLLEIQTESRIFIHRGRSMMGCLDETGTLEYGQVVVQFSDPTRPESRSFITGPVVVAKSQCLHPGDVRVLEAVEVPALSHMVDCVVFPQKGPRPHPNECSGSDLDGDMYFVCWDKELIPPKTSDPMDYTPQPPHILDHDLTIKEVEEKVPTCILRLPIKSFTLEAAFNYYDKDMEVEGFKDYINEAFLCKRNYDYKLGDLMVFYGIKTEVEILSFSKRSDAESIEKAVMLLKEEALLRFNAMKGDEMAKASACYHVTYHANYWGKCNYKCRHHHFLSFAWCFYDKLVKIKEKEKERRKHEEAGRLTGWFTLD